MDEMLDERFPELLESLLIHWDRILQLDSVALPARGFTVLPEFFGELMALTHVFSLQQSARSAAEEFRPAREPDNAFLEP